MTARFRPEIAARLLVGAGLAVFAWPALAQVYRCDSPNGVPVYQGTPNGANCHPIDLQPLTTIPAPRLPPAKAAGTASAARASPEAFPKVDGAAQRARDGDRRRILEDELKKEQQRLGELKAEYKGGEPDRQGNERNYQKYLDRVARLEEDIARTESNIASLRRELGTIRE
ncbi:MAG: DUF4124 domain-containing protein [Burkholderiaceae bacterium]|nr:DUF4124 domain-containing protein [Burkholderiaceae bacterium]